MNLVFQIPRLDITYGNGKFVLGGIENLTIRQGEILGILGESGCGKSTFGKCLVGLLSQLECHRLNVSSISFRGKVSEIRYLQNAPLIQGGNLFTCTRGELLAYRKEVQMIFQNPRASLNLNIPVEKLLDEAVKIGAPNLKKKDRSDIYRHYAELFNVGGDSWQRMARSKPKQLSGGELRRVSVAKVFCSQPDVIIADEPVASLDVSVRGKILNAIYSEWKERNSKWMTGRCQNPLTIIIISHDYQLIREICDRIFVFYGDVHVKRGTIVEILKSNTKSWHHPYTEELIEANTYLKNINKTRRLDKEASTEGIPVGGKRDFSQNGCVYVQRCPHSQDICYDAVPLSQRGENQVRCIMG